MNKIKFPEKIVKAVKGTKKYEIVNGDTVLIFENGKYRKLGINNISPFGILCDDLETFIKLEDFQ